MARGRGYGRYHSVGSGRGRELLLRRDVSGAGPGAEGGEEEADAARRDCGDDAVRCGHRRRARRYHAQRALVAQNQARDTAAPGRGLTARAGARWRVRLNDFLDEPMYSLEIDGVIVGHFNNWREQWMRP